ncbi:hypothetical protein MC885_010966 [Smutsia gigantea]|nr:hypothetical protein MC885_010966 [Smutsia gigantea]
MAAASELVALCPPRAVESVAGTDARASVSAAPREDVRVRCTSKRAVREMLELCGGFVQNLGDALPEEIRELALRDAQWVRAQSPPSSPAYRTPQVSRLRRILRQTGRTFESAVQENVSINGQAWQEASDTFMDSDIKVLEDQFDEIIVDLATKLSVYRQYHPVVHPLDLKYDPDPGESVFICGKNEASACNFYEFLIFF